MKPDFIIRENVPLADKTTFRIGGAARFFVAARSERDIVEAIHLAEKNDWEIFVLGGGSNVLIADEGFDGLVLQTALKGISVLPENGENVLVTAQAGEDWDDFVRFSVAENLAGVECLSGIPGLVGGTPVQNVGAYGQEVAESIVAVRAFDRKNKKFVDLTNRECGFSYRKSIFNTSQKNRYIVTGATYALRSGGAPKIVYKDLREFFGERRPNLLETREAVIKIRAAKSMVIDENDPNSRSAGSFFKNPLVSKNEFAQICDRASAAGLENVPHYPAGENVKVPAAWLIENAGFQKGFRRGNAGLSSRHTLAVVNLGAATAREILELKKEIEARVWARFGVALETEPVFVGFDRE
jgi:UDP-N-acetylmuramate dehydrogenase